MAVTKNWTYPATGAVDPTAAQVLNQNEVIVDLTTDGAAVTFTINHNMNFSAADLALGFPDVVFEAEATLFYTTQNLFISSKTANTVVLTFAAVASQFKVKITRPHSIVR